jgi:hypothetical protein
MSDSNGDPTAVTDGPAPAEPLMERIAARRGPSSPLLEAAAEFMPSLPVFSRLWRSNVEQRTTRYPARALTPRVAPRRYSEPCDALRRMAPPV